VPCVDHTSENLRTYRRLRTQHRLKSRTPRLKSYGYEDAATAAA